jgi:CheY-like chemotaxis protein
MRLQRVSGSLLARRGSPSAGPRTGPLLAPRTTDPPPAEVRNVTSADPKQTILVVDDNLDNVEILRAFLESRGYTIAEAGDGKSALAKMETVKPALVLLDVMMPGMDGWQVCRAIKNHPEFGGTTKVVMVTAKGAFEDKFEGLRSGADDYVVKPVDFKDLLEKVQRNLAAQGGAA